MKFPDNKAGRLVREFIDEALAQLPQGDRQAYLDSEETHYLYNEIYLILSVIEKQMGDVLRDPFIDPKEKIRIETNSTM